MTRELSGWTGVSVSRSSVERPAVRAGHDHAHVVARHHQRRTRSGCVAAVASQRTHGEGLAAARTRFGSDVLDSFWIMHGGLGASGSRLNDVVVLDMVSEWPRWSHPLDAACPRGRQPTRGARWPRSQTAHWTANPWTWPGTHSPSPGIPVSRCVLLAVVWTLSSPLLSSLLLSFLLTTSLRPPPPFSTPLFQAWRCWSAG